MKYAVSGHRLMGGHCSQDMRELTKSEDLVCGWLCRLIQGILVAVGLMWLATRRTGRVVLWLARALIWGGVMLWRAMRLIVAFYLALISVCLAVIWLLWLVIIWLQGMIYKILIVVVQWLEMLGRWVWGRLSMAWRWLAWEFSEPAACLICVTMGVFSANALPTIVLVEISPLGWVNLALPPLAIAAIAARVFDVRAYHRWRRGVRARLGTRMLRAYSDGVMWPMLLRREA